MKLLFLCILLQFQNATYPITRPSNIFIDFTMYFSKQDLFFTGSEVKPWTSDASISLKPNPGLPMFCLFLLMNKFLNS